MYCLVQLTKMQWFTKVHYAWQVVLPWWLSSSNQENEYIGSKPSLWEGTLRGNNAMLLPLYGQFNPIKALIINWGGG